MNWFLDRVLHRSVCFKSSGGGTSQIITDDMRASAEVATKQWNDYQNRFVPFENKYIADATSKDETQKLQGMVAADVAQKAGTPTVNPNQAGAQTGSTGKALAAGLTDARAGALDRKAQALGSVVSMGRGQQTEALTGLTDQAVTSGQIANQAAITDQQVATANRGTLFNGIGGALGATGAIAKNWSSSPTSSYSVAPSANVGPTVQNWEYTSGATGQKALNSTVLGNSWQNSSSLNW